MIDNQLVQEAEDCISWLESKDINAYNNGEVVYIILDNEDETHIMLDNSEVSYRASLWNELKNNQNVK